MSENLRYWLWLQRALGEGAYISKIIEDFGSAKDLYNSNILEWKMSASLTVKQVTRLEQTRLTDVDEIIYSCENNNWDIIDYEDIRYPKRLKEIVNPPAVLFVDGELPDFDNLAAIAIVGTRKASEYAVKVTHVMSRGITEAGALVISGAALGVDTYAHRGAIAAGGKTVAVLGCGFGSSYLHENKPLRDIIKKNGALITEYPPFTKASKTTFPMRNRIISGLSLGVLVVEAGVKSGSLITAKLALEQNRDVYAVPVSILSTDFAGTNKLIDDGAKVVTKPEHLIEAYSTFYDSIDLSKIRTVDELMYDESIKCANAEIDSKKYSFENLERGRAARAERQSTAMSLDKDSKAVYSCLDDTYKHIDLIINESGVSSSKAITALTQLELAGLAKSASGKRYRLS